MSFFGFATAEDLKSLATKDDLKSLATKDDLKPFVSLDGQLNDLSDKNTTVVETTNNIKENVTKNSSIIKSLTEKSEQNCTKILNGIHICNKPSYETVKTPFEVTYKDIFQGSDFCVGIKSAYDMVPPNFRRQAAAHFSNELDSDFPNNYVCIEGKKAKNYVDTFVNSKVVKYMSKHGDDYLLYKTNPKLMSPNMCSHACSRYTCDEIKSGVVKRERDKKQTDCVKEYTERFDKIKLSKKGDVTVNVITPDRINHAYNKERDHYAYRHCRVGEIVPNNSDGIEQCFGCDVSKKCNLTKL